MKNHFLWTDTICGSEMAALMDKIDWTLTEMGPVTDWPEDLRTALTICLGSKFPMAIWWGKNYTMFYNDAYRPMLGLSKHPYYLGMSGKDCWSEIWHILSPMFESVFLMKQATWSEDLLLEMDRNHYIEETYFTFSYSPLYNNLKEVYGIFNVCTETTSQVIGARRLKIARAMNQESKTVQAAAAQVLQVITENPLDIPFAILYLVDDTSASMTLAGTTGFNNTAKCPAAIDLLSPVGPLAILAASVFHTGKAKIAANMEELFTTIPSGPWQQPPASCIVLPIKHQGRNRISAILIAGISSHQIYDENYRSFFELFCAHTSTLFTTARVYEKEHQCAESEQKFAKVFHSNLCMMAIITAKTGAFVDINDRFLAILGFSREQVPYLTIGNSGIVTSPPVDSLLGAFANSDMLTNCEVELRNVANHCYTLSLSGSLVTLNNTKCILLMALDITEKKMYLNEITKLDRLNMVGQMAAGISHEIRNPLTTVKGYLQHLIRKPPLTPYYEQFALMISELDRASGIITEFLSLAKNRFVQQESCSLSELITELLPLIEATAMLESKVVFPVLESTAAIFADPKEIRQLILNIAKNGLEAMEPGGILTVKTYEQNNHVVLAIADNGCGISEEMLTKLGTPFMTTKTTGTGLGLPICYSIADRHNAKIRVVSDPSGTEFQFHFTPVHPLTTL
ncbi:ATP-binding protein [Anaerospora hongkongensis]|uniref:ATP-binding protein n=1 Tax=Anaerospora hongkongensis TaxID=244830 RepID=UPI00289D38BB|nr:ATP-binding protein [Anaerospora hongkongensis]